MHASAQSDLSLCYFYEHHGSREIVIIKNAHTDQSEWTDKFLIYMNIFVYLGPNTFELLKVKIGLLACGPSEN